MFFNLGFIVLFVFRFQRVNGEVAQITGSMGKDELE